MAAPERKFSCKYTYRNMLHKASTALLINPPFEDEYSVGSSKSIKYVLNVIPPLGLAYLSAALGKSGFAVEIIDGFLGNPDIPGIIADRPDIIGLTATTPTFNSA